MNPETLVIALAVAIVGTVALFFAFGVMAYRAGTRSNDDALEAAIQDRDYARERYARLYQRFVAYGDALRRADAAALDRLGGDPDPERVLREFPETLDPGGTGADPPGDPEAADSRGSRGVDSGASALADPSIRDRDPDATRRWRILP